MSERFASANSEGKLARATGRVLVGDNQYATIAVTCHIQAAQSRTGANIEELGESYLTDASVYALALGRALADGGTPPSRIEVDAECALDRTGGEARLSDLALNVRGDVPGCDQRTFEAAASDVRLLQSAWALPANANTRVAAHLNAEIDAARPPDEPANVKIDALPSSDVPADGGTAQPDERRGRHFSRRLMLLLAALAVAVLLYAAIGTVRDRLPPQVDAGSASTSTVPTSAVADTQAAPPPIEQAGTTSIEQPTALASPPPLQVAGTIAPTLTLPTSQPTAPAATPLPARAPASSPVATQFPSVAPAASPSATQLAAGATFEETFANNARRWPDDQSSSAWFGGGGYRLTPRRATQFVALNAPLSSSFGDVRVTGAFRKVAGPPGGGYGLILRDQSPAPLDGISQAGRYYVFEVGDRDGVGIWRRESDRWIDILPWTASPAVHGQDGTNELIAEAQGAQLDFFVNGELVATAEDATIAAGRVGIFTGGDGNDVLLTRFTVEPLS